MLLLTQSLDGAPELFLRAASQLAPFDPALSREIYLEAIQEAIYAGHLGNQDGLRNAAQAARSAPEAARPPRAIDLLLDGMVTRFTAGGAAGACALKTAVAAFAGKRTARSQKWRCSLRSRCGMTKPGGCWSSATSSSCDRPGTSPPCSWLSAILSPWKPCAGVSAPPAGQARRQPASGRPSASRLILMAAVILAGWRGREQETLALTRTAVPVMTAYGSGCGHCGHRLRHRSPVQRARSLRRGA